MSAAYLCESVQQHSSGHEKILYSVTGHTRVHAHVYLTRTNSRREQGKPDTNKEAREGEMECTPPQCGQVFPIFALLSAHDMMNTTYQHTPTHSPRHSA